MTHAPNSVGAQTPNPKFVPKAPSPTGPTTQNKWAKEEVCWQAALNDNVLIFYEKRGISPSDNSGSIFFPLLRCIPFSSQFFTETATGIALGKTGLQQEALNLQVRTYCTKRHKSTNCYWTRQKETGPSRKETAKTKLLMPLH